MSNSAKCPSRCMARCDRRIRVSATASRSVAGPVRGRCLGIAGGLARTQRERGFRHSVDHALDCIKAELGLCARPDKSQIRRFFQERLASDTITDLGKGFIDKAAAFLRSLKERLA